MTPPKRKPPRYVKYPAPSLTQKIGKCIDCRAALYEVHRRKNDTNGRAPTVWVTSTGSRTCASGKRQGWGHMLNAASYRGVPLQLGFASRRASRR